MLFLEMNSLNVVKVHGEKEDHKVFMYALSTCVWCKRTKQFLKDSAVAHEYVDVDLEDPENRRKIEKDLASRGCYSYPALIIDGKRLIAGFKIDEMKEALGL